MVAVHRETTQGIFQRKNLKSHFVEQKIKQGARDTPTAFALQVGPQPYIWEPLYAIMRQLDYG